jgi:hypothetical protein
MNYASRNQFVEIAARDRRYEDVLIDGVTSRVRSLTESELAEALGQPTNAAERATLIRLMVVDGEGNTIFREGDEESIIAGTPAEVSAPLFDACQKHLLNTIKKKNSGNGTLLGTNSPTNSENQIPT